MKAIQYDITFFQTLASPSLATKKEQDLVLQNAQKAEVRVAWQSNNEEFHCMQLHPRDMGGAFFEVDWDVQSDFSGSWHPAGGAGWQEDHHTSSVLRVTAVGIQSEQPQKVASHCSTVSGISLVPDSSEFVLHFANIFIKFAHIFSRDPNHNSSDFEKEWF